MKKLTDEQITQLEAWAKVAKRRGVNQTEEFIVETINLMSERDWAGVRVEKNEEPLTKEEAARKKLESLKRKSI